MKAVCSECVDVGLPVTQVFGFVSDVARWPVWLSFVVSAHCDGESLSSGLTAEQELRVCMQRGKRRWQETFDIVRFVPNAFMWLEGSLSAARRIEFRFEQRRSGTRVHCAVGYPVYGGAVGRLRDALFMRHGVARDVANSLLQLKSVLEEAAADEPVHSAVSVRGEDSARGSANEPLLA
jgi:uncharacterized membrane protein